MKAPELRALHDNTKYMLRNWYRWHRRSFLYLAARIPALVAVPMLMAYAPKVILDCVTAHAPVSALVLRVALLSAAIAAASWVAPFMQQKLEGSSQILRMRYAVLSFRKTMTADFVDVESLAGRERLERSATFTNSGSRDFCEVLCLLMQSVFGIITSVALLQKLPALMLLLLLLACAGEFLLYRLEYRADRKSREQRNRLLVKFSYFYRTSHEFSAGKDIRLFGLGDWFICMTAAALRAYTKVIRRYLGVSFSVSAARALVSAARDGVAYFFLITSVLDGRISVSDFIFLFGIVTGFSGYVSQLTAQYNQLIRCSLECTKFRDYVESPERGQIVLPALPKADGYAVEFRDVHFHYADSDRETIRGMSFSVRAGEKIAIVGENGAGKTTAIKLLCGLYAPTGGEVCVNGQVLSGVSQKSCFDLYSVVFQDYRFLPVSIAENVALRPMAEIDRTRLFDCLKKAGMYEKIQSLPEKEASKMDKSVFPGAVDFSGGEKQKLLLARALYKDAPILILDEPTAALDPIAENELYLQYNALSAHKTSFFISHRLSSTRFCDRILFIADGRVAEFGTHEELMQKHGRYFRMYALQSYYYREEANAL
ncbi:MAG TPA: ABC transporter ATP-binding protein [Candidatus Fimenecus excrementigallinarum]|uniref:ABC transporter ATP-binding protein n=1 Tax=Candidatus Fimenecus excrementigallinarum TaxID=2840816 RepID=A0A9D1IG55_9FIRM|nr:ABC transporter ATP-binding protein [Candidatus Fimenecus excrementigallinarum]